MKAKKSIQNLLAAFLSQGITVIFGFIIPRLTLTNYGSEINGFMSLVSQIYAYVALLEAGLGTTTVQALYKPIAEKNNNEISGIVNAAKIYYRRLSVIYTIALLAITSLLPFIIETELSKIQISTYFILFGISNVVNFWFTAAMKPILLAEGKNYVNSNIATVFHILLQVSKIILLSIGVDLIVLQTVYSIVSVMQIFVYFGYFKTNYKWLDKTVKPFFENLKQRNAFFIQQLNNLVFSCTDIMLISFFCSLKEASVYTVYLLIYNAISTLLSMFSSSTQFILGQTYNENKKNYLNIHRLYERVLLIIAFILFSTAYILTVPFIELYTAGITDVNYINISLALLLSLNGMLSTCKSVPLCLINFTYHAKNTINRTIIETAINLVLSLVFVQFWGATGVLLGTFIALLYRVIDLLLYSNKKILSTSIKEPLRLYLINFVLFGFIVFANYFSKITLSSYFSFVVIACFTVVIVSLVFILFNMFFDMEGMKNIFKLLKKSFHGGIK